MSLFWYVSTSESPFSISRKLDNGESLVSTFQTNSLEIPNIEGQLRERQPKSFPPIALPIEINLWKSLQQKLNNTLKAYFPSKWIVTFGMWNSYRRLIMVSLDNAHLERPQFIKLHLLLRYPALLLSTTVVQLKRLLSQGPEMNGIDYANSNAACCRHTKTSTTKLSDNTGVSYSIKLVRRRLTRKTWIREVIKMNELRD